MLLVPRKIRWNTFLTVEPVVVFRKWRKWRKKLPVKIKLRNNRVRRQTTRRR